MHKQLGQIMDNKIQKDQRDPLPLLKSLKQKQGIGGKSTLLSMTIPSSQHTTLPKMWANYLSHQSSPTPGHSPALTPYNE